MSFAAIIFLLPFQAHTQKLQLLLLLHLLHLPHLQYFFFPLIYIYMFIYIYIYIFVYLFIYLHSFSPILSALEKVLKVPFHFVRNHLGVNIDTKKNK